MTEQRPVFVFEELACANVPTPALVAEVPVDIKTKDTLLKQLAQRLRFPDYFGMNWDALDECICDLSWLPPGTILLKHLDLPLDNDVENAKAYLSILDHAVREVSGSSAHTLVAVFPASTRDRVSWLLRYAARKGP